MFKPVIQILKFCTTTNVSVTDRLALIRKLTLQVKL